MEGHGVGVANTNINRFESSFKPFKPTQPADCSDSIRLSSLGALAIGTYPVFVIVWF